MARKKKQAELDAFATGRAEAIAEEANTELEDPTTAVAVADVETPERALDLIEVGSAEIEVESPLIPEPPAAEEPKPKRTRKKKSFVTLEDVAKSTGLENSVQNVVTITNPETPLSRITLFDGIEDADDALTYRIPDVGFTLKGNGMFTDTPETPNLFTWKPKEDEQYFTEKDGMIVASYLSRLYDIPEDRQSLEYIIAKKHYRERIPDLLQHINYFIAHYDREQEYLIATLSVKRYIDKHPHTSQKAFRKMVLRRIITPTMISKVKHMAMDLYQLNINTDKDGKYKTTPKITNDHARMIVAISFCIRLILPLCIHFSNTNTTFVNKRDYIDCFDRIFMGVVDLFEEGDTEIWNPICRFVAYRVERSYTSDMVIWEKKKQLYGTTLELYLESLIHEVILVKSLHKLAYNRSIVSFIDGIITHSYTHYRYENFKYKPVEVEMEDNDSDEYMSHAETLEMAISRVDEANQLVMETNTDQVMEELSHRFNFPISDEEFQFYFDHMKFNSLTQVFLHTFFSKYFDDTNAVQLLDKTDAVKLVIYLKHFLQMRGMIVLPQIISATVRGKFKDTCIKNVKFMERFTTSAVYTHIIDTKYRYVRELGMKEDPIVKTLSSIINSKFIFVDFDPEIDGAVWDDMDIDIVVSEFMLFLSIC